MQPDGGLVEHVERLGEVRAERVRQLDALRLASRQRAGEPVERQVAEIDALEEAEPSRQFVQHRLRDDALGGREVEPRDVARRRGHGHLSDLRDAAPREPHMERLGAQARAPAGGAGAGGLVAPDDEAIARLVGLLLEPLQERDGPAEALPSVQHQFAVFRPHALPRQIERHVVLARQLLEPRPGDGAPRPGPGIDGALAQRLRGIGHDQFGREREHVAEAAAFGAHPERAVEREQRGLRAHRGSAAGAALPALAAALGRPGAAHQFEPALAAAEPRLARLDQALPLVRAPAEAVHHHPHGGRPARQARQRLQRHGLTVQADPREPRTQQIRGLLLPRHALRERDRRQDQQGLAGLPAFRFARDRTRAVHRHDAIAGRAMHGAEAREQQAEMVEDLGRGPDRGTCAARRRRLLDGDRRREPVDAVHVGARQPLEELPGVGRDRLDVAALSLGVERVEGQRGLPRARHARDHREPPSRQVEVEVLEVVLAGPADGDRVRRERGVDQRSLGLGCAGAAGRARIYHTGAGRERVRLAHP